MKRYLSILNKEENQFGFKDEADTILEADIEISEEDYLKYLDLNSQGKQFKLKEISAGSSLFEYVEEYEAEVIEEPQQAGTEDYLLDLEYRISKLELGV